MRTPVSQSASPNAARKHTATAKRNGFPRRFAQRDGGIPRFINLPPVPLGGMTEVFYPLLFLFPIGNFRTLATPQALCASSPRRGRQGRGAAVQQGKFSPPLHYLKGATRGAAKLRITSSKYIETTKNRPDGIPSGRLLYWLIACNYARPEEPFPLPSADEPSWSSRSPRASWKYT